MVVLSTANVKAIAAVLLIASISASSISAAEVQGSIEWNDLCPDYRALGSARASLDDGHDSSAGIRVDGTFIIPGVPAGIHILSVQARNHMFDQILVKVSEDSSSKPEVIPYIAGTPMTPIQSPVRLSYPIKLAASRQNNYFVPIQGFNLVGMLSNPMMMLMAFGGIMMFATPYLMKNLDPEVLKEVQDRQSSMANMQSSIQNMDMGSGLANLLGSGNKDDGASQLEKDQSNKRAGASRAKPTRGRRK